MLLYFAAIMRYTSGRILREAGICPPFKQGEQKMEKESLDSQSITLSQSQFRTYRIALVCSMLHAVCGVSIWCYNMEGELYFTTSNFKNELDILFSAGGCKERIFSGDRTPDVPVIMNDELGFAWAGEFIEGEEPVGKVLVLIGPAVFWETSVKTLEMRFREKNLAVHIRSMGSRILEHVPVVPLVMMNRYVCMLHYAVTEKTISEKDFVCQSRMPEDLQPGGVQVFAPEKHYLDYENDYASEQILLRNVRDGNLHYREHIQNIRAHAVPENYMTGDPMREARDIFIIFTAKCARAAIEGGLSPKIARRMETEAIRKAEKIRTVSDLSELNHRTYEQYILKVHELNEKGMISKPVQAVCDYVRAHYMEPIRLEDLARAACYSEYYLTRKFRKEMGVKLSDYIRDVRLEYAKIWLVSTRKSIQEISELLQFCSRNYFSRVFREKEGIGPQEFRDRAKVLQK